MTSLIIFDLDGTLLNTIDDLGNATNYALEQCGFATHALSAYPLFVGNGVAKLIYRALPPDHRDEAMVKKVHGIFTQYYDAHCTDGTRPYAGIPELLEQLNAAGIKMAVASNKYQSAAERVVRHYFPDTPFVAIEGNREGVPTKPDPSIVFNILAACPTPKNEVLYIGDSGVDMETARRACVTSVGVTWGFRTAKELREHYADYIVDRPEEILPIALPNQ